MFKLPFHEWTLQFNQQELELQYQQEQNKYRLLCLRMFNFTLLLVTLVSLFVFVAQQQSLTILLIQSGLVCLNFVNCLISKLYTKCFRIVFACNFIISVLASAYLSRGVDVPLFVYGHAVGTLLLFILQNLENLVKLIFVCASPFVLFGIYDTYHVSSLSFMSFTLICGVLTGIQLYHNEYNQRLVFSLKLICQKQQDLINEFVEESLILISFNERSRQLELEFQNKHFETEFNIQNTQTMKEFFRDVKLRDENSLHERKPSQNMTLEHCLFSIIDKEEGNIIESNSLNKLNVEIYKMNEKIEAQISVRKINFGKPLLLVQIRKEKKLLLNEECQQKLQQLGQTVTLEIQTSINILKQLVQEMSSFHIKRQEMQSILSSIFEIVNQMKNLILHIQQEKIELLRNDIKKLALTDLLDCVYPFLVSTSQKASRQFQLQYQVDTNFIVQINTKFLIQILINVFLISLKQAQGSIIMTVSQEINLNPIYDLNNHKITHNTINKNQPLISQQLIKFCFTFKSKIQNKKSLPSVSENDPIIIFLAFLNLLPTLIRLVILAFIFMFMVINHSWINPLWFSFDIMINKNHIFYCLILAFPIKSDSVLSSELTIINI